MDQEWFTAREAAEYMRISVHTLCREWVRRGIVYHPPLPAGAERQRWRFRRAWLDAALDRNPVCRARQTRRAAPKNFDLTGSSY